MPEQLRLKCVRCQSMDTKFCYFNNYNMSQPRYFCKTCRRHWTHGGTTRDVPVGGGVRRSNRRGGMVNIVPNVVAQGQSNPVGVNQYVVARGQVNPVGVNPNVIHNPSLYGPQFAVVKHPNDTSGNLYWDPWHMFPRNNHDTGSTSGASDDHDPSSTGPAA